jgi:hypothetical protein
MTADIISLLEALRTAGLEFMESNIGQRSEARLQGALANQVGTALTKSEDLKRIIVSSAEFSTSEKRRFIRLEDSTDGSRTISPLIYLDGDFSQDHPRFRVQLILVTYSSGAHEKPQCLLLRFETPEGADPSGTGKHDFYHSQLCTNLRMQGPNNTFTVPDSVSWLALSCPAWPLDAKTPIHLLACMIFALYGKPNGVRMLQRAYGDTLPALIAGMHFVAELGAPKIAKQETTKVKRKRKKRAKKH